MAKQLGFYFNASACAGCKACMIACKDRSSLPVGIKWRRVYHYGGGGWLSDPNNKDLLIPNNVFTYSISASCMHCQDPACVKVCPTTAITKNEDGIVTIDADKCIGCRYCEWACPYDAPQFDEAAGVMTKCDFCQDLLAQAENPACVDACPMRALKFGELEELQAEYGTLDAIEPLPSGEHTKPSLVVTPHKRAELAGEATGRVLNLPEEI